MAEMLFIPKNGTHQFGCYSERGLMSYFMFVQLPNQLPEFLKSLQFPKDVRNPFASLSEPIKRSIIFSELDFGKKHGFGCPDGVIYLEIPQPTMIFIEVKANESYVTSNVIRRLIDRNDGYNSTLKGQLELRWRLVELNRSLPSVGNAKATELRESDAMYDQYKDDDWFYRGRMINGVTSNRRHVKIKDGVEKFLDLLRKCDDRVFFLSITRENENLIGGQTPFDDDSSLRPNTFGMDWIDAKAKFCWLPIGSLNLVEQSDV